MLTITSNQLNIFESKLKNDFVEELETSILEAFKIFSRVYNFESDSLSIDVTSGIFDYLKQAESLGFTGKKDVISFSILKTFESSVFRQYPIWIWIIKILEAKEFSPASRMEAISNLLSDTDCRVCFPQFRFL